MFSGNGSGGACRYTSGIMHGSAARTDNSRGSGRTSRNQTEEFLSGGAAYPHYIGAIIVAEPPNQPFGTVRQRLLVDGQQRITTFQLVLLAIRELARELKEDAQIPVINSYLFNEVSGGMAKPEIEKYKLWPSSFDRKLYSDLADYQFPKISRMYTQSFYKNGRLKTGSAARLLAAYCYLIEKIKLFITNNGTEDAQPNVRLAMVLKGFLKGFRVVVIQLDDQDDAQEIFASLNGLGKPLKPIDLIRNDVFFRARQAGEDDEAIFEGQWKTFEDPFWEAMTRQGRFNKARIDFFLGHVLVAETGKEVNLGKLAAEYQHYARGREFASVTAEIEQILAYGTRLPGAGAGRRTSHRRRYRRLPEDVGPDDLLSARFPPRYPGTNGSGND